MDVVIEDKYLADLVNKDGKRGKPKFPAEIEAAFKRRIFQLRSVVNIHDLRKIKSLHFEKLSGVNDRYSIRVNISWRIILRIESNGTIQVLYVEELNNHYE